MSYNKDDLVLDSLKQLMQKAVIEEDKIITDITSNGYTDSVEDSEKPIEEKNASETVSDGKKVTKIFTKKTFRNLLLIDSQEKNKERIEKNSQEFKLTSYDLASGCIREILFRLLGYMPEDFGTVWLPVMMRASIGNAIHDFIQSISKKYGLFTEVEVMVKVPSIGISGRLDALINNNVLVEIKSCNYSDFDKILKTGYPREQDLLQGVLYKYLLENHIDEIKKQETYHGASLPKFNKYNIEFIQVIYVCHELVSGDTSNIIDAVEFAKNLRKLAKSHPSNRSISDFWFMHVITLDLRKIDVSPYVDYLIKKLDKIKDYYLSSKIPPMTDEFVKTSGCFFCIYKSVCEKN